MSSPELLLLIPLISSGLVILFRRRSKSTKFLSLGSLILLIIILILTKVRSPEVGNNDLQFITNTWQTYFGLMSLGLVQRNLLLVLYLGIGALICFSLLIDQGWLFTSFSQLLLTSLTGVLLSNSSTTGALFVLLGSAITTILAQGQKAGSTLTSFRSFTLAAIAFPGLLTTNYLLNTHPVDFFNWTPFFFLVIILILLLSFPFQIWIPSTVSEARSFVPAVSFGLVQLTLLLYLFSIIAENPIIFRNSQLLQLLRVSGVITVFLAVILLLNVSTRRRLLGYLVVMDLGATTMALALGANLGLELALFIVINRFVGLLIAGAALEIDRRTFVTESGERKSGVKMGIGDRSPLANGLLLYGFASIAGLPLTPGFAGRWALIKATSLQNSWQAAIVIIAMVATVVVMIRRFILQSSHHREGAVLDRIDARATRSAMAILLLLGLLMTIFSPAVLAFARSLVDGL